MSDLQEIYTRRFREVLQPLAPRLEEYLRELFEGMPRIDRISARAKSTERFIEKAEKLDGEKHKYVDPIHQIQDQLGARIITFYRSDVDRVTDQILRYFQPIESKDLVPESEWEFGYFGKHFVLAIPTDILSDAFDGGLIPQFFELQIKTLFQHAWSEANHDLGYKTRSGELTGDASRRLAFTSAQAWGADRIFNELFLEASNQQ